MSAWLMDEQSLSNLANWFYFENDTHGTYRECKRHIFKLFPDYNTDKFKDNWDKFLAKELYLLNCYSLNQRYGDKMEDFKEFKYKEPQTISKMQCLKSVQCWLYQSCEGDAETKPLYKVMQKIETALLYTLISELKEYQEAEWN